LDAAQVGGRHGLPPIAGSYNADRTGLVDGGFWCRVWDL
jgi:hypothetical protein